MFGRAAILFTVFTCIGLAAQGVPPEPKALAKPVPLAIEGWYDSAGLDGDGKPTSGVAVIDRMQSGNYRIHWLYADSGRADAVGHRDGNFFLVGYGKPVPVVMKYSVEADKNGNPTLRGRWYSWQNDGEETLTWMKGLATKE